MSMMDENNKFNQAMKLLVEGSSFGEIGLIHKCPRTADISAKNYVTLASISEQSFKYLTNEIQNLRKMLIR